NSWIHIRNWGFVQMLKRVEEQRFMDFKEELGLDYTYDVPRDRIASLCSWFEYVMEIRKYLRKGGSLDDIDEENPITLFASMASGNSTANGSRFMMIDNDS
ncbi:unnamed protein product, partial [Amoebophrya sp. A25]